VARTSVTTPALPQTTPCERQPRADARRNRETLLVSAAQAFAERGVETSLEDIAKRSGVGIGTLYRHFPTRHDLIAAVYLREVDLLCGGVDDLLATLPADEALAAWMRRFVSYVAAKRGMASALKSMLGVDSEVFTHSRQRIAAAIGSLLEAAAASGVIRSGVDPDDLLRAMGGFCMINDQPGWQDQAIRLVGLLIDGLRYGAPGTAVATS
jgi:AcrR family transcriptional regulator